MNKPCTHLAEPSSILDKTASKPYELTQGSNFSFVNEQRRGESYDGKDDKG